MLTYLYRYAGKGQFVPVLFIRPERCFRDFLGNSPCVCGQFSSIPPASCHVVWSLASEIREGKGVT